jgi:signal transduction histidine kinase/CheY-like chemotaxis protein/AraC-like DNA-binding protein
MVLYLAAWLANAAAPEATAPTEWSVQRWTSQDGLPLDHLNRIALDDRGYLWLTTFDGLSRFDGANFETYRRSDIPEFRSNRFVHLARLLDGRLIVNDEFGTVYSIDPSERPIRPTVLVGDGARHIVTAEAHIWLVGAQVVRQLRSGAPEPLDVLTLDKASGDTIDEPSLAADGSSLWLLTRQAAIRLGGDGEQTLLPWPAISKGPLQEADGVTPLEHGGVTYSYYAGNILNWKGGVWTPMNVEDPTSSPLCGLYADSTGPVLIGTERTWRLVQDTWRITSTAARTCAPVQTHHQHVWTGEGASIAVDGRPVAEIGSKEINQFLSDPSGAVWVATHAGLLRIRPAPVWGWPPNTSLPAENVHHDGLRTWAGLGTSTWTAAALGEPNELSGEVWWPRSLRPGPDGRLRSMSRLGRLWESGPGEWVEAGVGPTPVESHWTRTGDGTAWVMSLEGTYRQVGSVWREVHLADGRRIGGVRVLFSMGDDRVGMLAGETGLIVGPPDNLRVRGLAGGLPSVDLRGFLVEPGAALWLGTEDAGLCRIDLTSNPDPITAPIGCVGVADGLRDHNVHNLALDAEGRFWLGTNRGLLVVPKSAVLDRLAGGDRLAPIRVDDRDGMPTRETNGGQWSITRVGPWMLWPTMRGIAVVDPAKIPTVIGGTISVDVIRVDGSPRAVSETLRLTPDERELSIRWSTPEFVRPDQVEFRSRLVGVDEGWRWGPERERTWSNLPPGSFTLELQARLGGAWGPTRTVLVRREPAFVETNAFLASLVTAGALLAGAAVAAAAAVRGQARRQREHELSAAVKRQTAELREQNEAIEAQSQQLRIQALQLAELDAARSRFVANLSHELRSPLMLVMAPLADLEADPSLGPAADRIRLAARNATRLKDLVDQLFDVVRLEAGRIPFRARRLNLSVFTQDLVDQYRTVADSRGLVLHGPGSAGGPEVWADPDLLEKILVNLLSNALKFTPPGGRVGVSLTVDDPGAPPTLARLRVTDTGPGVPAEARLRIFDRFFQADDGDNRRADGAGIGLSLARDLAELHGGTLRLIDTVGPGATLELAIPLGADHLSPEDISQEPASAPLAPVPDPAPSGKERRVLVVEDHLELRAYLASSLSEAFVVDQASDGESALQSLHTGAYGAVVTDLMMPGMDGLALTRAIRDLYPDLPVILLTAKGRGAAEEAKAAGANLFLQKPVPMKALVEALRSWLPPREPEGVVGEDSADNQEIGLTLGDAALLARIEAVAKEHMADPAFSVETLGRKVAMSRRTLQRALNRLTGKAPNAWLQELRLEVGRELLREGAGVSEAAEKVGFSPSYFTRLYTTWFGHPPSQEPERRIERVP